MIEIHGKAPYRDVPYSVNDAKRLFHMATVSKKHLTLVVADNKHRIYGVCIAHVAMNWWGARIASELITYCNVPGWIDKLMRQYLDWAKRSGADVISFMNNAGENPRFDQLIQHKGFIPMGALYMYQPENSDG